MPLWPWRSRFSLSLFAALSPLFLGAPAGATIMVEIPIEQMVQEAEVVVRGTVQRTGARLLMKDGAVQPVTIVKLQVTEVLKGEQAAAVGDVVQVRVPGGRAGTRETVVDGAPRYRAGEQVLAFLEWDSEQPGAFRTHQMAQGKFELTQAETGSGARIARRDFRSVAFADWDRNNHLRVREAGQEPAFAADDLIDFVRRTHGAAQKRGAR